MKSLFASLLVAASCLLIGGCSITPQLQGKPHRPPPALMEPPPVLRPLPGEGPVSDQAALTTVVENYGLFHQVVAQLVALQGWVREVSK